MAKVPEVIASCYVESIDSNVLLVKDIYKPSTDVIVIINGTMYFHIASQINEAEDHIEFVKAAMESGLVSIRLNRLSHGLSYFIYFNNKHRQLYCVAPQDEHLIRFVNENRDLFEGDGHPILK